MKYLWYGFLGLFSLGFLGVITVFALMGYVFTVFGKDLPNYAQLEDYDPPIVTRLYAGDGQLMAEFAQEKRIFVPIENIPDIVKNAFIAAEDKNFYDHSGVDLMAIFRAVLGNVKEMGSGRRPKGASTITQQVAKNFLLTNELSYKRKIREAILAYRMEKVMSKDRLLELYLNEIYLGARAYGIGAAAQHYFNKALSELSIAEMAYLAALPKAPNNYNPVKNYDRALERRNWVIERMREDGYITKSQEELANLEPLKIVPRDEQSVDAPYFAEEIRRFLAEKYGEKSLYGDGFVVRTTIDPRLQKTAVKSLRDGLMAYDRRHGYRGPLTHFESMDDWQKKLTEIKKPKGLINEWALAVVLSVDDKKADIGFVDGTKGTVPLSTMAWARKSLSGGYALGAEIKSAKDVVKTGDVIVVKAMGKNAEYAFKQIPLVQGALVALNPHTGRILAMQGGWEYDHGTSAYNRATQANRQPGSAFKPFVYLAALDKGYTPATLVLDGPFSIQDRPGHWWSPTNYRDEYYGPTPIRAGVEKSRNLMTVRLAHHIGMKTISKYAEKFGITDKMAPHLSNSLGAGETTLMRLTSAYGVLVNGGKKIEPAMIDRIQDRRGKTIYRHDSRPCKNCGDKMQWVGQDKPDIPDTREQISDPRTSYQMVSILEGVIERGTGKSIAELGRPLAGKTGTTNESKDAWFVGFSPDLVVGVFVGFDQPKSLGKRETGSSVAVPIFKEFMKEALQDEPILPFRVPPGIRHVRVDPKTGQRNFGSSSIWEAFVIGTEPNSGESLGLYSATTPISNDNDEDIEMQDGETQLTDTIAVEPIDADTATDNETSNPNTPAQNFEENKPIDDSYRPSNQTGAQRPAQLPYQESDINDNSDYNVGTGGLY